MITAQEAYEKVCQKLDSIDITDDLAIIEKRIEEAVEHGHFNIYSQPFPLSNAGKAEKLAIYLQEEGGYGATVINGPSMQIEEGSVVPTAIINISWKYLPANTRESMQTRF